MTQWITKQESASLSEQRDNSPYEYKVFTSSLSMVHTRAWPRIEPSTKIHFRSHFRGFFINMYIYLWLDICIHVHRFIYTYMHINTHIMVVSAMQHTTTHCNTLQHTATHCNTLQHTAIHCNTLQRTATHTRQKHSPHASTLQHAATRCNMPQHITTHCNTLHRTATQRSLPSRQIIEAKSTYVLKAWEFLIFIYGQQPMSPCCLCLASHPIYLF